MVEFRTFIIEYVDPDGTPDAPYMGTNLSAYDYADAQRRLNSIRSTGIIRPENFLSPRFCPHPTKTYVVQCSETKRVKIGKTRLTVKGRISSMQLPADAEILLTIEEDIEQELHAIYKDKRLKGEWFDPSVLDTIGVEIDRILDKKYEGVR